MSAKPAVKLRRPPDNVVRGHLKRLLRTRGESEVTLCNHVEDVMEDRRRGCWGSRELGQHLEVTFLESVKLNIYASMRPCDVSDEFMQVYLKHRRQERDRVKKRKIREMRKNDPNWDLSPRARELAAVLHAGRDGWMRAIDAVHQLQGRRASVWPRKRHAFAKAVARAAIELCRRGVAEQIVRPGRGGLPTRLLRGIFAPPTKISPRTMSSKTKTCLPDRREQQTSALFESENFLATIVPVQSLYTDGTRLAERPEEVAEGATFDRPNARPEGIANGGRSKSEDLAPLGDRRRNVRVAAVIEKPAEQEVPARKRETR